MSDMINATAYPDIRQESPERVICRGFRDEGCAEVTIPDGVTEIADYAFCNQDEIVRVHCPGSIRSIGEEAFQNCEQMEEIILPAEAEGVLNRTFRDCYRLRSAAVPRGITEIAYSTFYSCEALKAVTIPDTVTKIGAAALYGCRPWSDGELKALLTLCCTPLDPADSRPAYDVGREYTERVGALANI